MISLLEYEIYGIIQEKLKYIKDHVDMVDYIFKVSPKVRQELKTFILNTDIKVIIGYPRTPSQVPCYCILLGGEDGSQAGIGDLEYVDYEEGLSQEHITSSYSLSYRIECWATNGDLVVQLYNILKWILLSSRGELVALGMYLQSLSGADYEPAPSFFPEFVYRRSLSLEGETSISLPLELPESWDIIDSIQVSDSF